MLSEYLFLCLFIPSWDHQVPTPFLFCLYFCAGEAATVIWTTSALGAVQTKTSKWCLLVSDGSSISLHSLHKRGSVTFSFNLVSNNSAKTAKIFICQFDLGSNCALPQFPWTSYEPVQICHAQFKSMSRSDFRGLSELSDHQVNSWFHCTWLWILCASTYELLCHVLYVYQRGWGTSEVQFLRLDETCVHCMGRRTGLLVQMSLSTLKPL